MSTRSYTQTAKVDLDLWPRDPKSIGFLLSSWRMCMWSLKVIGQKLCSRYRAHKVLYTECQSWPCQSWPWPLTPWPKINRVSPLIMANVHVKFESDWAKTVVAIVPTRFYIQSAKVDLAKVDLDLWPRDPKSIGFLLSSWQMCMWSLKVIGQKTVVAIVPTRFYIQSAKVDLAKVDLDLWPRDPKSIGFLLSSWGMCMWSLKLIGQKL